MIQQCRYVIAIPNLRRSTEYYCNVLGFEVIVTIPGWQFFRRDNCIIMAGECADALPLGAIGDHSYFAYLEVDDAERLYASFVTAGAEVVKPLRAEPWGMLEFGIRTIDGHRMMFGATLLPPSAPGCDT
jgi:uncharacterized glyoxalase superfamily protein PhnB